MSYMIMRAGRGRKRERTQSLLRVVTMVLDHLDPGPRGRPHS